MKNIDFRNGRPLVMMVSQYDFGYDLQVALWSNGDPVTITAAEIVSENFTTTCTFSGNVVTIPVGTSMTEQFGHFPAELRVTDSLGQVSSKNFDFFVERSPLAVKSTQTYSGDIVEFTAKRVPLSSVVVTMVPIQSGSGDPSPTNVRHITGRTGASVVVSGKNLLPCNQNSQTASGITITKDRTTSVVTISGTATANGFSNIFAATNDLGGLLKGVAYTATVADSTLYMNVYYYDDGYKMFPASSLTECTFTIPDTATGFLIRIGWYSGKSYSGENIGLMIRLASETDTTYAPHTSTTYPITFTSADTVYAGTVDLVSGRLEVTHVYRDDWANVAATWSIANGGMVNMAASGWDNPMASGSWFEDASTLCNILQKSNGVITGTPTIRFGNNNGNVYCYGLSDLGIASAADFRTWAADNGLAITYPLATPLTYTLTPTQVMSLLGENVVWSPDGTIEVVVPEYY